jgi:protoporphyrinogen oxidase
MLRIVIIGGGPTGLGAAYHLYKLGYENWTVYEKSGYLGGHAASFTDEKGFVWDEGVHVIFSHYLSFNRFLDQLLGKDYLEHVRETWIRIMGMWVPYPFQNNIGHLPKEILLECLIGLINAHGTNIVDHSINFRDWIEARFGKGISKYFMHPYNSKIWAIPLERMSSLWINERVSVVDIQRVLENVVYLKDDVSWGPNSKFKFPLYGGTGEIYRRIEPYIAKHLEYHKELIEVDVEKKELRFSDGTTDRYDALINTIPLDLLCQILRPTLNEIKEAANLLEYNSMLVVGIGLKKNLKSSKSWIYFPEENTPFYRATYLSNLSPFNVPAGDTDEYSSIMCETSYSSYRPEDKGTILQRTIKGLVNTGILNYDDVNHFVSTCVRDIKYSYPIPTLEMGSALRILQPFLEQHAIFSRGRFGGWKYEIGNMDHSVMQGIEAVDRILFGKNETIYKVDSENA